MSMFMIVWVKYKSRNIVVSEQALLILKNMSCFHANI